MPCHPSRGANNLLRSLELTPPLFLSAAGFVSLAGGVSRLFAAMDGLNIMFNLLSNKLFKHCVAWLNMLRAREKKATRRWLGSSMNVSASQRLQLRRQLSRLHG